jgi:hypothetical protein
MDSERERELIAAARDRVPEAFFNRAEAIGDRPVVDPEQRPGRGGVLPKTE